MRPILLILLLFSVVRGLADSIPEKNYPVPGNVISSELLKWYWYQNLQYERIVSPDFSVGINVGNYSEIFTNHSGNRADLLAKFFFTSNPGEGFYLQGKVSWIVVKGTIHDNVSSHQYYPEDSVENNTSQTTEGYYHAFGGGVKIGWQKFLGKKKNWIVDLGVELQYIPYPVPQSTESYIQEEYDRSGNLVRKYEDHDKYHQGNEKTLWSLLGPGAIFNPRIRFGYAF